MINQVGHLFYFVCRPKKMFLCELKLDIYFRFRSYFQNRSESPDNMFGLNDRICLKIKRKKKNIKENLDELT